MVMSKLQTVVHALVDQVLSLLDKPGMRAEREMIVKFNQEDSKLFKLIGGGPQSN